MFICRVLEQIDDCLADIKSTTQHMFVCLCAVCVCVAHMPLVTTMLMTDSLMLWTPTRSEKPPPQSGCGPTPKLLA